MKHLSLKFALFCALFFAPVIISGCCHCSDTTIPPETFYETTGLIGSVRYLNNTNDTHFANEITLFFEPRLRYYASAPCLQTMGGASLMACKCIIPNNDGKKGTPEKAKNIQITSNTDFKSNYPTGTDLSPLMLLSATYPQPQATQIDKMKIADFLLKNPFAPQSFKLFFDASPDANKKHIFTIRYELDNGEIYTYTTPEITFK